MRSTNIANPTDVLKDHERILRGLEDRVRGIVVNLLSDAQTNLSAELHGVALEVMQAVMEFEVLSIAGPKGKHLTGRQYVRWGYNPGSVVINGAKVRCQVPRIVEEETMTARSLTTYEKFRHVREVVRRAYVDLIRGISTRRFQQGVEDFVEAHGISASTVSRHMIKATAQKVEELFSRSLAEVDLAVLMLDGVDVGGHTMLIALGIDTQGVKHILWLRQGATENAAVAKGLLEELVERGLSVDRSILVVIDGAKALRRAVNDVLGADTPVQRCTVHKKRNVLEYLPKTERAWVSRRMSQAYDESNEQKARAILTTLADQLQRINPDAAKSLLEGLDETLTVQRLKLPKELRLSLRSTNIIESANNGVRDRSRNVKRWRDGMQVERWTAASLMETARSFRRIRGCDHMPVLVTALSNYRKQETEAA